jgi:hypothetical protein
MEYKEFTPWISKILGVSMVPKEGIEPSFLTEHDFESCASANSATPAGL